MIEAQSVDISPDPIWVAKFSHDGMYLATGGKDKVLRIFKISSIESGDVDPEDLIETTPFREYSTHTHDIISISWSSKSTNLILTSSFDKKVILWDINYDRPLCIFEHPDIATCVAFRPN